ncbi:MAG: hypothetical protein JNM99_18275 [Verrucomicrobiaceae bacterium]|nr:hypothetical protein [Verrucomicrobiaceae bacterium]
MSVREIEHAIEELPAEQFRELRNWFADRDMEAWDQQIETDSATGKLDSLINRAMDEYHAGQARDL